MHIIRFHLSSLRCCKLYWIMISFYYLRKINFQLNYYIDFNSTNNKMRKLVHLRIDKILFVFLFFFFHTIISGLLKKHFTFIRLIWKKTYLEWIKDVTGFGRSMEFSDTEMCSVATVGGNVQVSVAKNNRASTEFLPLLVHVVRVLMANYYHLCL